MTETSASRKDDHVRLATEQAEQRSLYSDFDSVQFIHHALRACDVDAVSLETHVAGKSWSVPLYINAMTGGSESTGLINAQLSRVAQETGLAIASGSMSRVVKDPSVADSYRVLRQSNPDGIVFANLSANATVEQGKRVVDLIEADALQLHLNSVQEIVMPEGDRSFTHWPARIADMVQALDVPVIVKEVGFGLSAETAAELYELGVTTIDVSGRGGTNFAAIENARRVHSDFSELSHWGQSTVCSLVDVVNANTDDRLTVLASGGVRSPMDVAISLALGARAVGVAGGFLHILQQQGEEALVTEIQRWIEQLRSIFSILGAPTSQALQQSDLVIGGSVRSYSEARGIDLTQYARRSSGKRRGTDV